MPSKQGFPLVGGAVRSVWTLELLIHLRAEKEACDVASLARDLRTNESMAADALRSLVTAGLVTQDGAGAFAYSPASALLDQHAAALEKAYRERPVSVINAIVASSTDALRNFADAFRLKGDGE